MPTPTPTPLDQINSQLNNIRWSFENLQKRVKLTSARDQLEDLDTKLKGLAQRIAVLRQRGYPFEKILESTAIDLQKKWSPVKQSVQIQINQQSTLLETALRPLETRLGQVTSTATRSPSLAMPSVKALEADVKNLEDKASAADSAINGMYDTLESEANLLFTHLTRVEWALTAAEQASFKLMPTESIIMAVKAVWAPDGREDDKDPEGILYLTDQRLLFEQKEEVATKKVLFVTTERKMVQQLLAEAPLALVQEIQATKQGVFKNEDHLDFIFSHGAPYQKMHFHIDGQNCNDWKALVNRVITGEFTKDRAIAIDQAAVDKVKNAPTICPSCGGTIKQVVLRGQDSITCEYCGLVIRL